MILVIDKTKHSAVNLSDMFYYMGILSHATTPTDAFSEISPMYRAIIITSLHTLPDVRDYVRKLRRYSGEIPIFAVGNEELIGYEALFERCYPVSFAARIANDIIRYHDETGRSVPGRYTLAGIDASAGYSSARYYLDSLPFTKTEIMILRALIRAYPSPISAQRIINYAYRPVKMPAPSNVRTHISSMNKKFNALTGRNLIYPTFREGYGILTPEKAEELTALTV